MNIDGAIETIIDEKLPTHMRAFIAWNDNSIKFGFIVDINGESKRFSLKIDDVGEDFDTAEVLGQIVDNQTELYNTYVDAFEFLIENVSDEDYENIIGNVKIPDRI